MNIVKPQKRTISGILLLNKPIGLSSNQALQKVKRLFHAKKAGHTGSLDPLASGLLPICFGEATKLSQYLLEADKQYQVTAKLGVKTTTSDAEGEIVFERPVPTFTLQELNKALDHFRGDIEQIPSMYSALKFNGRPLYELARKGIEVERKSRRVTIYEIKMLEYAHDLLRLEIKCSKGTYIRTLVEDLGDLLQCGAHVAQLHRLSVAQYQPEKMVTLENLEKEYQNDNVTALDNYLLSMVSMVEHYPELRFTNDMAFYLRQGQAVFVSQAPNSGLVRLCTKEGVIFGIGEVMENKMVTPRRILKIA